MAIMDKVQMHRDICKELNQIYERKNHDYGDSFHQTWIEEGYAMARIRLSDKLNRFKKLSKIEDAKVKDESLEDTLLDLANYAIMTVMEMRLDKSNEIKVEDDAESRMKNSIEKLQNLEYPTSVNPINETIYLKLSDPHKLSE